MSDVRIRDFAVEAEQLVDLPDLAALAERGKRLRRRRRAAAAGLVAAAAVAVAGGYLATIDGRAEIDPVDDPPTGHAAPYPGGSQLPALAGGTYEMVLDREGFPARARFTVPEGWKGWFGPNLPYLRLGYVGLLVSDVEEVAERVCQFPVSDMRPVGDSPQQLIEALSALPAHQILAGPTAVTFAGRPSTHLVLRADSDASCSGSQYLEIWHSPGGGGLIPSPGPGTLMDLWVVDVGGEAVLVTAVVGPGTPQWAVDELDAVVDSVELVEGQD